MRQIDLLIYCDNPNQGEELVSQARSLGVALNHQVVSSSYEFSVAAQSRAFQFALVTVNPKRPNLNEINTSSGMVIIALIEKGIKTSPADLIEQGATDAVKLADKHYFKHILKTQINLFFTKKLLNQHHDKLDEAQQQLSVLLQSTTQPIAFIHEGFHVFANPAYLALLGYNKLESLQATLFLDLIREDHQQAITDVMHGLQHQPASSSAFATTFVSQDEDELAYQVLLSASRFDSEPAIQIILDKPLQTLDTPVPMRPAQRVIPLSDPVTQLYAEHHMLKLLSDTIEYSRKNNTQYMLYLIHLETGPDDVDYTNRCMQEAALKLDKKINENDVLGHFSNNSFLLLSSYDRHKNPGVYAQQLRHVIGDLDGLLLGLTHSRIAGVIIDAYCKDSEDALARLKDNFFEAQEYHDNIKIDTAQFIHAPGSQLMDQVWARKVSTILKDNRLTLLSNPVISLKHDDYERFTLELQLNDEHGAEIPTQMFTNTVKQTGLSSSVDRWIIFNAGSFDLFCVVKRIQT